MKCLALLVILGCMTAASVWAAAGPRTGVENMVELTPANLEETLKPHALSLVFFRKVYNCDDCKTIAKPMNEAALALRNVNPPILVGEFRCDDQQDFVIKYGLSNFPTVKFFRDGKEVFRPFRADLSDANAIVEYATKLQLNPSTEVSTIDEAEAFVPTKEGVSTDKIVIFGFYAKTDGDLQTLMKAEDELRDIPTLQFIHTSSDKVMKHYGIRGTFAIYNPDFDEPFVFPKEESPTVWSITDFVSDNGLQLVGDYDTFARNLYNRKGPNRPLMFLMVPRVNSHMRAYYRRKLTPVARKYYPNLPFVMAEPRVVERLHIVPYPEKVMKNGAAFGIANQETRWAPTEFDPEGAFNAEIIDKFVQDYLDRKIEPFVKSAPEPANNPKPGQGHVIEVTSRTFDQLVLNPAYDTLLMIYSPDCGYCTDLMPKLEKIARYFKGNDTVVIGKMDGQRNELHKHYPSRGYPTIWMASAGQLKSTPELYAMEQRTPQLGRFVLERVHSYLVDQSVSLKHKKIIPGFEDPRPDEIDELMANHVQLPDAASTAGRPRHDEL